MDDKGVEDRLRADDLDIMPLGKNQVDGQSKQHTSRLAASP